MDNTFEYIPSSTAMFVTVFPTPIMSGALYSSESVTQWAAVSAIVEDTTEQPQKPKGFDKKR